MTGRYVRRWTMGSLMDDQRFGSAVRSVRLKKRWRQVDLAKAANVSPSTVSRVERGHLDQLSLETIRGVARALDVRVDLVARWRAGDLDRLLNARHSQLHEHLARMFRDELPAWVLRPETSFAIYAERGVIDILAWHAGRRALLVIELKTDIVDVNELVGVVDRKRRLAPEIVAPFGWEPATVSIWVIVADGRTNRKRIAVHNAMLRAAFPTDGRSMRSWLRDPVGAVSALSTWHNDHGQTAMADAVPVRRVRRPRPKGGRARSRTEPSVKAA
jgi:transcriptional regulator with XRE-family HTH domain